MEDASLNNLASDALRDAPEETSNALNNNLTDSPIIELSLERSLCDEDSFLYHDTLCETLSSLSFKTGRVEQDYEESVKVNIKPSVQGADNERIKGSFNSIGFENLGLKCTCENGVLKIVGKPTKVFDGTVKIILREKFSIRKNTPNMSSRRVPNANQYGCNRTDEYDDFVVERPFVINPDPWTLWEEHEPSPDAPYPKPHVDSQYGRLEGEANLQPLTLLAASRRGRSHAHTGTFRDDHFGVKLAKDPSDWSFIVVADGAGSAKYSREGSRIACETALANLDECFNRSQQGYDALEKIKAEIASKNNAGELLTTPIFDASTLGVNGLVYSVARSVYMSLFEKEAETEKKTKISDYNTTLLCAAIKRLPSTELSPSLWVIVTYWVGDGGIVVESPNGQSTTLALTEPDGGDFAGQTRFITMRNLIMPDEVATRVRVAVVKDFKALVLMTDGVSDPFFPNEKDIADRELWEKFWDVEFPTHFPCVLDKSKSLEERAKAFEDALDFKVQGNHDDRTLVLLLDENEKPNPLEQDSSVNNAVVIVPTSDAEPLTDNSAMAPPSEISVNLDVPAQSFTVCNDVTKEDAEPINLDKDELHTPDKT